MAARTKRLALVIASSAAALLLLDVLSHLAFSHPGLLPSGLPLLVLRGIYMNNRDFIQYNRDCAQYDSALTYTLRPGRCNFSNVEFDTEILVNSRGLRDDEVSLLRPDIIVLGDSHAMGWGVAEGESFPSILEREMNVNVLNSAISSYGTGREVEIVRRLDHASAQVLIVQYCGNDFEENRAFVLNNFNLTPMKEDVYNATVHDIASSRGYVLGKHIMRTVEVQAWHRLARTVVGSDRLPNPTGPAPRAESPDYAAELFLQILEHSRLLAGRRLVLIRAIDAFEAKNDFLEAVERRTARDTQSNIRIIDLSDDLGPEHYFRIDDHINALGHRVVAERLYAEICGQDERLGWRCGGEGPRLPAGRASRDQQ